VLPSRLVTPDARLRLEQAASEAEQRSRGELAVVVVEACDAYRDAGWRLGAALAAAALLLPFASGIAASWPVLLAGQAVALAAGRLLARLPGVRRLLVSQALREIRVAERARRSFAEQGLPRAAGECGVLIFVALLERRVVVLAGAGLHDPQAPGPWEEVVDRVTAGLRSGGAEAGLRDGIARCGEVLAARAPGSGGADPARLRVVLED